MMNYIDLFAGAGGLSEGFVRHGFNPVAHIEMNPNACLTLKTRACYYYLDRTHQIEQYRKYLAGQITRDELYSLVPVTELNTVINETMSDHSMLGIYKQVDGSMKAKEVENVDLIVGGPPCQAYSLVGRAVSPNGMCDDPRNYLYKLYIRMLKHYKPKMFVFENVPGLLTANKGMYFQNIQDAFRQAGYHIFTKTFNAQNFGVLQSRHRVIIIGWRKKMDLPDPEFETKEWEYTVKDLLSDLPAIQAGQTCSRYKQSRCNSYLKKSGIRQTGDILTWHTARPNIERDREIYRLVISAWNDNHTRLKYSELPAELCTHRNRTAFLDRFKVVAADLPACHTMMAHISKDGHYFIHPDITQARSITVREAARIQSFPDNYYFEGSRTSAFTQIGNAVPPLMAEAIAKTIAGMLR